MEATFGLAVRRENRTAVLIPTGELDLSSAPELEAELERAWQSQVEAVIVDLRAVSFMDSTGLRVILNANQTARAKDVQLAIVDGSDQVRKLFDLTGVSETLTVVTVHENLCDEGVSASSCGVPPSRPWGRLP